MSQQTTTLPGSIAETLTEHEFMPPCDFYLVAKCPVHGRKEPCPRPARWAVVFKPCPGCDKATGPALWCAGHLTFALSDFLNGDCACGQVFRPFRLAIQSYQPLNGGT